MITLSEIETSARKLRDARDAVSEIVTKLHADIASLQREATRRIKAAVARTAERRSELYNLIDGNRALFAKPRTQVFHGVKCGVAKGKGSIEFEDEDRVIANIEKKLPDQVDFLIKTEKKILKNLLKTLTVDDLKKIGCTVEETGDYVVISFADKEVDKLVNALLKSAVEEAQQEAA